MLYDGKEFIRMISPYYLSNGSVETGIWIAEDKQGMGYGKKAMIELSERMRIEGVKEIVYETDAENLPSINLAKSLGFSGTVDGDMFRSIKNLLV